MSDRIEMQLWNATLKINVKIKQRKIQFNTRGWGRYDKIGLTLTTTVCFSKYRHFKFQNVATQKWQHKHRHKIFSWTKIVSVFFFHDKNWFWFCIMSTTNSRFQQQFDILSTRLNNKIVICTFQIGYDERLTMGQISYFS